MLSLTEIFLIIFIAGVFEFAVLVTLYNIGITPVLAIRGKGADRKRYAKDIDLSKPIAVVIVVQLLISFIGLIITSFFE